MPSLLFVAFIAIASLQGTFGAPSCGSKDLGSCISKCKAKMGHHTWGSLSYNPNPVPTSSSGNSDQPTSAAKLEGTTPTSAPTTPSSTPSAAASTQPSSSTPSASSSSVSSTDIEAYLSAHNSVRALHGANPLTWNNSLSSVAQAWADVCKFQHSGGPDGENLAAGTGDYSIAAAVGSWTSEVSDYDPINPVPSHFTQVVWKETTEVGCAVQRCNGIFPASYGLANYYVCEYSPAGNVIGRFAQNVQV